MGTRTSEDRHSSRCRVCGTDAGLTFEHLPPKSAFNTNPATVFGLEGWLRGGHDDGPYTLCDDCGAAAGARYVPEFGEWRRQAAEIIAGGPADAELNKSPRPTWTTADFFEVKPARFLKAAVTMLLSIAPAGFLSDGHGELGEYARNPKRRGLPSRYQLYLSLYRGPFARFVGYSAQLDVDSGRSDQLIELAYPPFSFVLSLDGDAGIETTNITDFAELALDEVCIVDLDLLNGFGHTPFPADFRTLAAVERDREADRRAA